VERKKVAHSMEFHSEPVRFAQGKLREESAFSYLYGTTPDASLRDAPLSMTYPYLTYII